MNHIHAQSKHQSLRWTLVLCASLSFVGTTAWADSKGAVRETNIRAGSQQTIVSVRGLKPSVSAAAGVTASAEFPRPRLVGPSALVAIATSDERRPRQDELYEHDLHSGYVGSPLNAPASENFVIGFLDSGADGHVVAGSSALTLGLVDPYLTNNTIPLGGVGEEILGTISWPIGLFAAGLSAVDSLGVLDLAAVVGHTNVATVVIPPIDCGQGEVVTAIAGMPLIAFHETIIRVDNPQTVSVGGQTYHGPDVQLSAINPFDPLPDFVAHTITMQFEPNDFLPQTANYWPDLLNPFPEDPDAPWAPTSLSSIRGFIPTGGLFYATIFVLEGEPGPTNPAQEMLVMVDTGAQSSIISEVMAANLSLPFDSDFTVDVCGVGGLVTGVAGYYIDNVRINAFGGAIEFSHAPFVVLNLSIPNVGVIDGILGMNFFWNRNVMFEPVWGPDRLVLAKFHVSAPIPVAYADNDVDFDVDSTDAATQLSCLTGPGPTIVNPECDHFDAEGDSDIDLIDVQRLQICFSGAGETADPQCGP